MVEQTTNLGDEFSVVEVTRKEGKSGIVIVCEHASHTIPSELNVLGLELEAQRSHIAWDPGALAVAKTMSQQLDAVLVASTVSRLVYDCNRPPDAPDAMPIRSEAYDVPGNRGLTEAQKNNRTARYYQPFFNTIKSEIARVAKPVLITIHSFTPVYHGNKRAVELGILHDTDSRLADAILALADQYDVRRNEPYGPEDGVTHTLKAHAIQNGHLNAMIEIRNDLIADGESQAAMAGTLTRWISRALDDLGVDACKG